MHRESDVRYYGWIIVALSFVVLLASYSLLYGYSVFIPFLTKALKLSRAEVSAPFSVCIATYSVMSLISGQLTDRVGPRPVILAAGVLMVLGFAVLGAAHAAWPLYLGLSALFGLGMSGAFIPTTATLVRWFVVQRGTAVGLANVGGSAALAAGPIAGAALIQAFGWRTALFAAGLIGGSLVSLAALGFRRDPGMAYLSTIPASATDRAQGTKEVSFTLSQARRTGAFWMLCAIYLMAWSAMFFPFAHFIAIAVDLGLGTEGGVRFFLLTGAGGILGRLGIGWLSDRIGRKGGLVGFLAAQGLACLLFAGFSDTPVLYAAATLFGIGAGASISLYPAVFGDIFGRAHVGSIAGFAFAFSCTGGGVGPLVGGWLRDRSGSYSEAFLFFALICLSAIICALALRRPRDPTSD